MMQIGRPEYRSERSIADRLSAFSEPHRPETTCMASRQISQFCRSKVSSNTLPHDLPETKVTSRPCH